MRAVFGWTSGVWWHLAQARVDDVAGFESFTRGAESEVCGQFDLSVATRAADRARPRLGVRCEIESKDARATGNEKPAGRSPVAENRERTVERESLADCAEVEPPSPFKARDGRRCGIERKARSRVAIVGIDPVEMYRHALFLRRDRRVSRERVERSVCERRRLERNREAFRRLR
jgi:hypothetical protein